MTPLQNEEINAFFFSPSAFTEHMTDEDYQEFNSSIDTLDALSRMRNLSIYVIDYYKRNFLYVSPNHIFLNGLGAKEFQEMGFSFFEKFTSKEDYEILKMINSEGFKFYNQLPVAERLRHTISYNFQLKTKSKKTIPINHQLTPIKLDGKNNRIWLAICIVSLAPKGIEHAIEIKNQNTSNQFIYNIESAKWTEVPAIQLSPTEISVIRLAAQGFSNSETAKELNLDTNTIKFHRKSIFLKLAVTNIRDAVVYARNAKLI